MDSPPTKEASSIDTITNSPTPSTTATNLHSTTSKPDPKRTLSDTEPTTCPSLPSSSPLVTPTTDTDSTAPSTASATTPPSTLEATSSPTAHLSSMIESKQPTTSAIPADSLSTDTQSTTISKPKIIILHHDTILDGRHIITRTIQNCFAAILGPNVPQPSEAAILNAFAHNVTLGEALGQLGAFKTSGGKPAASSSAGGGGGAAATTAAVAAANSDATTKSDAKGKGKAKAIDQDPSTPTQTQEEQQYDYQHTIALWTQAYLHYTHEFLSEFDIYSDLEPFAKQMRQQGVTVVILIAGDGFEPSSPEQTSSKDGDKDGKKKTPAKAVKGVKIIQELMKRMGVTAAGKGARGYQGLGRGTSRQADGGGGAGTVVMDGIYACGIEGERVARVWRAEILPLVVPSDAVPKGAVNSDGKLSKKVKADTGTATTDPPVMQKDEVLFACCSKQYLSLARAIGATACWVARYENKAAAEQQADIVVDDLEKLGQVIVGESNGKGEEAVVDARHSGEKSKISTAETKGQTPKNGKATLETEDIEMPDADHNDEAVLAQGTKGRNDDGGEQKSERKLASPKAMKAIKTEPTEDAAVAIIANQKGPTGKKRARDDLDEWLPVKMGGEEVPCVDLTEEP
ncbi:hypothetical protein B0H65DRAFT_304093 [Neurospora tetraspora]|uniref:Uncharacterized protein n=1 Tax=Neurospora tetraspora TaxID=94610 RepID=A0AAE0J9L9_9PEZI|nr:hypothetical protein B0H65DRAFT_304093 [Neurospora tetraspora]